MKLGETIKLLRTEQGLTQPELAQKAQIEQGYLSKLENDKATPSFDIINRIATALGLNGMELIGRLGHSYIAQHLSHIPEVAAEYASIRQQVERRLKRLLLTAGVCIVTGIGAFVGGMTDLFFPGTWYQYESLGVLKNDDMVWQFVDHPVDEINESVEEWALRMQQNRSRLDPEYRLMYSYRGRQFIETVPAGRRYFTQTGAGEGQRWENELFKALGAMLVAAGMFLWFHVERFKPR